MTEKVNEKEILRNPDWVYEYNVVTDRYYDAGTAAVEILSG